jgi:hypothetical protein
MKHAVVTGCDSRFVPGAKALLEGAKKLHPDVARFCITPPEDAAAVQDSLGELASVFPAPRKIRGIPDNRQPALLRLFMPLVPADIAVWIDSDIVFCRSAAELWEVNPGEVVAVRDTAYTVENMVEPEFRDLFRRQFPDVICKPGFNSGLFALRTAEWIDLAEKYESAFDKGGYTYHPKIWDQPFLNGLLQPNVRYLPYSYNAHHVFDYTIPADVRLVHFTSALKPWMPNYPKHEPAYYYWLRYGLNDVSPITLLFSKLRIWMRTPLRITTRYFRSRRS